MNLCYPVVLVAGNDWLEYYCTKGCIRELVCKTPAFRKYS